MDFVTGVCFGIVLGILIDGSINYSIKMKRKKTLLKQIPKFHKNNGK